MIDSHPEVGDPFSWAPSAFTEHSNCTAALLGASVMLHGRVIQVNEAHRWFRVEAICPGGVIRETFKF